MLFRSHAFLLSRGTVAEREAQAIDSPSYKNAVEEWVDKYKDFKILDNKRTHEIRITEIWQTLSANRRKGTI